MIRENLVLRKITLIQNELVKLADLAKYSLREMTGDSVKQAALERYLERIIIGIYPADFSQRIARSVGTRNILIHEYDAVDYSSIYSLISDCLRGYHEYCNYILLFMEQYKSRKE